MEVEVYMSICRYTLGHAALQYAPPPPLRQERLPAPVSHLRGPPHQHASRTFLSSGDSGQLVTVVTVLVLVTVESKDIGDCGDSVTSCDCGDCGDGTGGDSGNIVTVVALVAV